MHTTASDGRLTPAGLVARAAAAHLTTIAVTDHDTVASIAEATALGNKVGIRVIPGIEITAVEGGRDVHVLGYFFDPDDDDLAAFLISQRAVRVNRVREIAALLAGLDMFIDIDHLLMEAATRPGSSVGRPQIARALVRAGYVSSVQDAFDVWLASGRPAYVPRNGPTPIDVVHAIHEAGGIASFAHPGVTKRDDLLEPLAKSGLDAIEVYHSDHSPEETSRYRRMAARLKILVTGGSDFHGEDPDKPELSFAKATEGRRARSRLGVVVLPRTYFAALELRVSQSLDETHG